MLKRPIIILTIVLNCFLSSCLLLPKPPESPRQPDTYTVHVYICKTINIIVYLNSNIVDRNTDNPQVTFSGQVLDVDTNEPVAGVAIRIVGTDIPDPGGNTITRFDGKWEMTLPIVPYRNDENTTMIVIEVQKEGAVTASLAAYCQNNHEVWDLLHVNNPNEYQVAGAYYHSIAWEDLHEKIECPIVVKMQK